MKEGNKIKVRNLLLIISSIFLFYGVYKGEVDLVFSKAIRICLECIGIG